MMGRCGVFLFLASGVLCAAAAPQSKAATTISSSRNAVDNQIIAALETFRSQMLDGWPELGVPPLDPLVLGDVNLNVSVNGSRLEGLLSEVTVNGLSTFNIDLVHYAYFKFKVNIDLGIPLLDVVGTYNVTGAAGSFPVYGAGAFKMDALNLTLAGVGDVSLGLGGFKLTGLHLDMGVLATDIQLEGIMGGGEMGDFVNGVLSSMGPDILQSLEDKYMPWLEEALLHEINQIINGPSSKRLKDDSVNDYFDLVFANMRLSIQEQGLDPLPVPGDADDFSITLYNFTMAGRVEAGPGRLWGLSSVHRAGDMHLTYLGGLDEVVWHGEVGLIDLQVDYRVALTLPLLGKELSLSAKMSFVHLSFETDVFLHQSELTFVYCNVTEMGPVHFKETGAGPLDTTLYNLVVNTLLGELQGVVASSVEGVVCDLLEGAFASS